MLRVIIAVLVGIFSNMAFTVELGMKDKPTLRFFLAIALATIVAVGTWLVLGLDW